MNIIVGGGRYGCEAIEFLHQKDKNFAVVDKDANCLAVKRFKIKASDHMDSERDYFVHGGLPEALELIETLKPEYVFPTAPIHLASDLARIKFKLKPWNEGINTILPKLPEELSCRRKGEKSLQASIETTAA